ncbi:MAG: ISKra4 family transposase [Anaerolineales bacterium]|jgi:hypothetical protein
MTFNSTEIIQDIRTDFEQMLDFVMGEEARTATADQIERGLFSLLLSLGAKLLGLFFVMRSQACARGKHQGAEGCELPYQQDKKRDYYSIFGKLPIWRPYFYQKGMGGQFPLDAELSLGDDCYSDLVREVCEYLGVYTVYGQSSDILRRLLGLNLSTRVIQENIAEDARDVEAYYAQKPAPDSTEEAEILVIQADGKGVPLILDPPAEAKVRLGKGQKRGRKKEALVTTVYTMAAHPRTPQEVVGSYFHPDSREKPASPPPKPQNKHLWATLDGKDTALRRLSHQVNLRQGEHIQHQVALCDGCQALQSRIRAQFPDFVLVLDFIHAEEYLWQVANCLLGETNDQRFQWMAQHTLQMLSGDTAQLIRDFRQLAQQPKTSQAQRQQLHRTANYFERNMPYMDYPTCLANGWPIASGVIEGACRHFVKDRCELSGMRWHQSGVENLLRLRAVAENDDWDAYHAFRRRQRHRRLFGSPSSNTQPIEIQVIHSPSPSPDPIPSTHPPNYHQLPLAA